MGTTTVVIPHLKQRVMSQQRHYLLTYAVCCYKWSELFDGNYSLEYHFVPSKSFSQIVSSICGPIYGYSCRSLPLCMCVLINHSSTEAETRW